MPRLPWTFSLIALALAALACSLVNKPAAGTGSLGSVRELWDDVPRMDGLAAPDEDLPLVAQLLVRTLVRNLTGDGEGAGNWIVFITDETYEAVEAFYTEERMAEHGWDGSGRSTCTTGSAQGIDEVGVMCVFQKQVDQTFNALMVISAQDANSGQSYVVFIRIAAEATPEPTP